MNPDATMYLVATSSSLRGASPQVGVMIGPRVRGYAPISEGRWWASDNDGFTGQFDAEVFMAHLLRLQPYAARCLFVAAPDVFGDAATTLALFQAWRGTLDALDFPVAYVAQNGQEGHPLPDTAHWLFLAGTDAWRGRHGPSLIAEARARGYWGVYVRGPREQPAPPAGLRGPGRGQLRRHVPQLPGRRVGPAGHRALARRWRRTTRSLHAAQRRITERYRYEFQRGKYYVGIILNAPEHRSCGGAASIHQETRRASFEKAVILALQFRFHSSYCVHVKSNQSAARLRPHD